MSIKRPKILEDAGYDLYIDMQKLHALDLPAEEIEIKELLWHFDLPFWERDNTDDWNLTPQETLENKEGTSDHQKKIEEANLNYPIYIIRRKGKWVVLDGLHRLAKAYKLKQEKIKAMIVPESKISELLK